MPGRTLKDLDRIQEQGSLRLSTRQARSLAACVAALLVLAFVLGMQVGRVLSPTAVEVTAPDVASADRSIAEILDGYRAASSPRATATANAADDADARLPEEPTPEEPTPEEPTPEEPTPEEPTPEEPTPEEPTPEEPAPEEPSPEEPSTPDMLPPIPQVPQVDIPPEPASPWSSLPAPGSHGGYAVQLAAFSTASEAEAMASTLREAGVDAYLMEVEVRGETWHRVRVGRFGARADAAAWLGGLDEYTPFDPIVVTE